MNLVATLRKRLNLTPSQFAQRLGTTPVTVWRWEQGKSRPLPVYRAIMEKLARSLQGKTE